MRIIGGACRGRPLKTPKNQDIRPTSDKVRQAIFNALFSRGAVEGARVLDGFCGTGALGLEALSQGADTCLFCDISRTSLTLARENAGELNVLDRAEFKQMDVTKLSKAPDGQKFDLVFLDPPYRKELIVPCVQGLREYGWLEDGAWLVLESEREWPYPAHLGTLDFEKQYGETIVRFLSA